jgi:hypothetical protein
MARKEPNPPPPPKSKRPKPPPAPPPISQSDRELAKHGIIIVGGLRIPVAEYDENGVIK